MAVKLDRFHTHNILIIKYLFLMSTAAELSLEGVLRGLLLTSVTSTWEFLMILLFLEPWHMRFHLCYVST